MVVIEQIIPSPYKQDPVNTDGVVTTPVAVCPGDWGEFFVLDREPCALLRCTFHNPVQVVVLTSGEFRSPNSIAFADGVVFVADTGNNRVVYVDIGGNTRINPSSKGP